MHLLRAILLCATAVLAYDPSKRVCTTGSSLCLTSFHWCSFPGSHRGETGYSPLAEGEYLHGSDSDNSWSLYALLISTNTYNVSWKKTTDDAYPVRLRWLFQDPGKHPVNGRTARWEISKASAP